MKPYYQDDLVTLWHGDCREITEWLAADVLITDPPYGISWKRSLNKRRASAAHAGIVNDGDTAARDDILAMWGPDRAAAVFGSLDAPFPEERTQKLVWRKPPDSGVVGSTCGFRRDVELVFLAGPWPKRAAQWSSVLDSGARNSGNPAGLAARYGHPHAKPVDVMERLLMAAPHGVIADPFAGSGSTLVAAKLQGRRAIGVEVDAGHCRTIADRLAQDALPFDEVAS